MKHLLSISIAAAGLAATVFTPASAAVFSSNRFFDDRAAFEEAVNGLSLIEDGFDSASPPVADPTTRVTFESGVVAEDSAFTGGMGGLNVENGFFFATVLETTASDGAPVINTVSLTFPVEVIAFGFDFFDAEQFGLAVGFLVEFDNGSGFARRSLFPDCGFCDTTADGFFGATLQGGITEIVFSVADPDSFASAAGTPFELFALDNLVFATAPSEVPLPAAAPLFVAGVAGFSFLRRRRNAQG